MESVTTADMSSELFRTASFGQNPPKPVTSFGDSRVFAPFPSISKLSKAGFYRDPTSDGDEVKCFSCGLVLRNWNALYNQSPIALHLYKSPNCEYVTCQTSDNPAPASGGLTPVSSRSGSPPFQFPLLTEAESITARRQLFPGDENENNNNNTTILTAGQIQSKIKLPFKPKFGDTSNMFEKKRLESFASTACMKARELAASGFTVMERNKLICVFCGGKMDCPSVECTLGVDELHKNINPNCPFLRGFDLGNVSCELEKAVKRDNGEEGNSDSDISTPQSDLFYNPYFEDFTLRRESFADWPPQMKPSAQDLTEAGFFYSGTFDKVTCFVCGCSLRRWETDADALIQHAKHSPDCAYLQKLHNYEDIKQGAAIAQELTKCEMLVKDGPISNELPVKLPFPFKPSVDMSVITNCQAALANAYPNYELLIGHMLTTRKEIQMMREMRGNIAVQEEVIVKKDHVIQKQSQEFTQQIQHKDHEIQHKDHEIQHKDHEIQHKDHEIQHKDHEIQHKDHEIQENRQQIQEKDHKIEEHRQMILDQNRQQVSDMEQFNDRVSELKEENMRLKQQSDCEKQFLQASLASKDNVNQHQKDRIDQLEDDNIRMQNMIMQLRRELQASTSRRG